MMRFVGRFQGDRFACNPPAESYEQIRLVWRGFVSNSDEILKEAARRAVKIRSGSVGEILALAYRWWGDSMQSRVIGEYSLAIFDQNTATLLLTHDAFGLVPIFYRTTSAGLMFGSHLEDIVPESGLEDIDDEYIADYVADCFYSSDRTPYRSVRRLGFGRTIICAANRINERTTWQFGRTFSEVTSTGDDRDFEDRFSSLLEGAIAGALTANGPVWSELSGGLDSSTVAAVASQTGGKSVEALSLVYSQYAQADESNWMQLLLDHHPMRWHKVNGDDALPFSMLPNRFCAEPGLPMIDWGWRRNYEEIIKTNGVSAVLTGQGGDFVLFGLGTEPYYLADLLRTVSLRRLRAEAANWQKADRQKRSFLFWLTRYALSPLISYLHRPPQRPGRRATMSPWIDTRYLRRMALSERVGRTLPGKYRSVEQCWFIDTMSKMCGRIANLNQMPETFEFRHPLLNRPLVEFMLSLPSNQKFNPEMNRFLQRRAVRPILPEALRLRNDKTTFDQPFYEGLRKGKVWTSLLVANSRVVELGIVDQSKWNDAVAQAKLGRTHSLAQFQAVATLEIWLRQMESSPSGRGRLSMPTDQTLAGAP
jgi:asparagine synthase (glutamine-hydrolysing)